jgi:small subunit ribosomal protein S1
LEKKEKFGYFVSLAPGITGLMPISKISGAGKPGLIEQLKIGDSLVVTVEEIHPNERKITLAPIDSKDEAAWKDFSQTETPLLKSDLAEKLQQAMESKNNK